MPTKKPSPARGKPAPRAAAKKAPVKKVAAKKPAVKKAAGRPSLFTEALAVTICQRIANKESLRRICMSSGMPNRATVNRWLEDRQDFATKYVRAREEQADFIVEDCAAIEDKVLKGRLDPAAARVVLSSKQWRASKLASKKYGDKLEHSTEDGMPIFNLVTKDYTGKTKPAEDAN